ncbi:DUF1045 domain-containing protein [Oleidesulfovibrio sp.]|uniref:DUF1045 domain-containing protein n=1 Tax=Oleidesulfovibrio sp. TaxID=2909707 RepID=UPI003A83A5F0
MTGTMNQPRYAVYVAPEKESMLDRLGVDWLGRTAEAPQRVRSNAPEGFGDDEYRQLVAAPRHYGFHGTLKAPFELHPEQDEKALRSGMKALAATLVPFEVGPLRISFLNRFLALLPATDSSRLARLHAICLRELDIFRAPLSDYDHARHMSKGLSGRQERLLGRFGYPFVLEDFRFHMTLTGNLEERQRHSCRDRLEQLLRAYLKTPLTVREICLFVQEDRSRPFRLSERFALKGDA